jgi:hypothetical protein
MLRFSSAHALSLNVICIFEMACRSYFETIFVGLV